ncbi:MAG TPA: ABC transporter permease [Pyrinomonadaceae bacterium]
MWWRRLFHRSESEAELEKELRFHLDQHAGDLIARGHSPAEARRRARLALGGPEQVKEGCRDARGTRWLEELLQDLRYGARAMSKNPAFTIAALLTLALGIGANTAIFSVVNAVLLRPLPYPEPARLVTPVGEKNDPGARTVVSYPDFLDWRDQTQALERVAAYTQSSMLLRRGEAEPELISGANVTADLFPLLRVRTALGRAFTREEDKPGAAPVILISHDVWRNRFNADPGVIGQPLNRGAAGSAIVVGVLPEGFVFPAQSIRTDYLRPLAPSLGEWAERRGAFSLRVLARLKQGATAGQAEAEMRVIGDRLERQYPDAGSRLGTRFVSLHESVVGGVRAPLLVLLGAVGLLLLVACANVGNLLLARAASRHREIAVRTALGASRLRVVRQLLTESVLLSLAGAGLGVPLAVWGVRLIVGGAGVALPRLTDVSPDGRVTAFTIAVTGLTGVAFGLAPALQASRVELHEALKEGERGASAGAARARLRAALVVSEVALSLVLLAGAGLLLKSFVRLRGVDPGFDARRVLTTALSLSKTKYPGTEQRRAHFAEIVERVRAVPGVESAAAIYPLPFGGAESSNSFLVLGREAPPPGDRPSANYRAVSHDYFRVMRMSLARGRAFTEHDGEGAPPVVIVNETFARRFLPGRDPLGERVVIERAGGGRDVQEPREIVGVVGDVRHAGLDEEAGPEFYVPYSQAPESYMSVVVRTAVDNPAGIGVGVRDAIRAADAGQYVPAVRPMTELVAESVAHRRFGALLTGLFAALALSLASVGIYGVTSYTVTQRRHEIGIRMALGAQPRDVLRLVVGQGSRQLLAGLGIGLALSLAATRVLAGMLYHVTPTDPVTFALVTLALSSVALLACYLPARRATKVDPLIALRYE